MKFKIINPHDPYTLEAPDLCIAALAIGLIGCGKYGLIGDDVDDEAHSVPVFLLGGHDQWFIEHFGASYKDVLDAGLRERNEDIAAALESVTLARESRSSIVNLAVLARDLAKAVRDVLARSAAGVLQE